MVSVILSTQVAFFFMLAVYAGAIAACVALARRADTAAGRYFWASAAAMVASIAALIAGQVLTTPAPTILALAVAAGWGAYWFLRV